MLLFRLIYADTSIWNRLCDEKADPHMLLSELAKRNAVPVFGFNVLYEIAKLFFSGTPEDARRGRKLMDYVKQYLVLQVPIFKENPSLLIEEAMHVTGHKRIGIFFLGFQPASARDSRDRKVMRRRHCATSKAVF